MAEDTPTGDPGGAAFADRVLDTALELAAETGWAGVHLHEVARRMDVPLVRITERFPDKDAVANLLFARALDAVMRAGEAPGFSSLPERERIFRVMSAWFDYLEAERETVRAMLAYKLTPAHLHLQAAAVVNLSRTVQWMREAAGLSATGRAREREEVALSLLFLAALGMWLLRGAARQELHHFIRERLHGAASRLIWPAAL